MGERYYLGVYWGHRLESVDACAERARKVLESLRALEPALFPRWYVWKESKEASLEHPLDEGQGNVRDSLRVPRQEPDAPLKPDVDPGGFALELWNGAPTPDMTCRFEMTTGVHHGAWNVPAPNDCEVQLPLAPSPELRLSRRAWRSSSRPSRATSRPTGGRCSTNQHLLSSAGSREPGAPLVGWLTFLAAGRGRAPRELPPGASVEIVDGLGAIYTASASSFDWQAADTLRAALEKAKLARPTWSFARRERRGRAARTTPRSISRRWRSRSPIARAVAPSAPTISPPPRPRWWSSRRRAPRRRSRRCSISRASRGRRERRGQGFPARAPRARATLTHRIRGAPLYPPFAAIARSYPTEPP